MVMPLHRQKNQKPQEEERTLRIMQANVGRGDSSNDLALALAFEEEIDILLILELWIGVDLERKLLKNTEAIKLMLRRKNGKNGLEYTYVRRQDSLRPIEKRQDLSRIIDETLDIFFLEFKPGLYKESIFIVNVYNALIGCERAGRSAEILMDIPELLQKRSLIIGDINLRYTDWDNRTGKKVIGLGWGR